MVPAASSLSGRKITFQRLDGGRWRVVRQVPMKEEETPYGRTYVALIRRRCREGRASARR